jgi:RNA polymerase sigma-70 factor (ECF subfamily)
MAGILKRIEECIPALRRYAWVLVRDDEKADDLVQDCLVRALDRLATRRDDPDVRPWLFAILHNQFVDLYRRARVRGPEARFEEALGHAHPPAQEDVLKIRDLLRGLDALSDEQRQVLLLVTVEGQSYAEVASVLGIPVGTVMSRLGRARQHLRELTEGDGRPRLRRVK